MTVQFNIPGELEARLRNRLPDINQAAKEATLVELYRQEQISRYELGQALDLSRMEVDGLLKRHHVTEDSPTAAEINEDYQKLRELLKR